AIQSPSQSVLRPIGNLQRLAEIARPNDTQDRAEDLLLGNDSFRIDVYKDCRINEIACRIAGLTTGHQPSLRAARFDVAENRLMSPPVDHRPEVDISGIQLSRANKLRNPLQQTLNKQVIYGLKNDCSRTGRTLLPLI